MGWNDGVALGGEAGPTPFESPAAPGRDETARRLPLSDDAMYEEIYRAIVEHHLTPGSKLTEDALAEVFGVSRTRINRILQRLAHENIVTLQRNRGAFVAKPSVKEARDVFAARRLVEAETTAACARLANERQIARLRDFVAQEAAAQDRQEQRIRIKLSGDFHLMVAELLDNGALSGFLRALVSRTSLVIAVYEAPGGPPCRCSDHGDIVELIAKRQAKAAVSAMVGHLKRIEDSLDFDDAAKPQIDLRKVFARLASDGSR
jgi:DNA-binding GntR family transcriptional regulator